VATRSMRKRSFVKDAQSVNGGALLGYARVSKGDDQNNLLQAKALRAAGCRRIFEEAASGGRWDRPELHRMLDHLREGDTVVVWKLDRLSRSLRTCCTSWSEALRLAPAFGRLRRISTPQRRQAA
jgi:predicted site-specific integrase-resolvase